MPLGGANTNNRIPGYNTPRPGGGNSRPGSGGNSTPSGKGSGTWVSGQNSSRSNRANHGAGNSGSGKRKRGSGRGSRPKKGVGGNTTPRSNTATSRPLGSSGILGVTPTGAVGAYRKGGFYALGGYLFLAVLGVFDTSGAITTVPEHLRQPGETQQIEDPGEPPFKGGQDPNGEYQVTYTVNARHAFGAIYPYSLSVRVSGQILDVKIPEDSSRAVVCFRPPGSSTIRSEKQFETNSKVHLEVLEVKIYKIDSSTGNSSLDTTGSPPSSDSGITSSSTTNNNTPPPERATVDNPPPPGIRPPLPSDRFANPKPSRGIKKPSSKNYSGKPEKPSVVSSSTKEPPPGIFTKDDKRLKVELPSAVNTPAPEPPPPQKHTSPEDPDAGKTFKFGKQKTDGEEEEAESEVKPEPVIIDVTQTRRADGTVVTTTTREATEEEMREYNRTIEKATAVVEKDRRFRFGDNYDGGIDTDTNLGSPPSKTSTEVEEEERTSPGKINNKVKPVPPETDDDKVKPPGEPDDPDTPPFVPPPPVKQNDTTECKGCNKKIFDKLGGLNLAAQGLDILLVQEIHSTVHHPKHGLAKIQSFAQTAWKAAQGDKIMSGVTMALTVHNAMMLSNNLASTISEALNMSLNALNLRNEEDKEIDIGAAIRTKINEVLSSILGAENYAALTARIAKANRIYQASINLLDTTYSLFDSARTVAELTAENTGKIGNALRESGAVYEDAYDEFLEKVNPQNASQRKLDKFREGLESVENVFDTVSQISGSVVETRENIQQIKEEKNSLIEEVNTEIEIKKEEKDTAKIENQVTTDISDNDFDRATEEN